MVHLHLLSLYGALCLPWMDLAHWSVGVLWDSPGFLNHYQKKMTLRSVHLTEIHRCRFWKKSVGRWGGTGKITETFFNHWPVIFCPGYKGSANKSISSFADIFDSSIWNNFFYSPWWDRAAKLISGCSDGPDCSALHSYKALVNERVIWIFHCHWISPTHHWGQKDFSMSRSSKNWTLNIS